MATLKTAPGPTERIVELVGTHRAAVAVENCNSQTVVSGTVQGMERVKDVAHAVGIHFQKLNSHYPHYCPPIMHPLRETLAARLCYLPSQPLQVPVFSPVMQRYYESVERFTDCLAEHFTRRLKFASAVHRVCDQGIRTFVECGPLYGLCDIVNALLKERPSDGFACVHPEIGDRIETQISIQSLEMLVA